MFIWNLSIWGLLPITLLIINYGYARSHNEAIMWIILILSLTGNISVAIFWFISKNHKSESEEFYWDILIIIVLIFIAYGIYHIPVIHKPIVNNITDVKKFLIAIPFLLGILIVFNIAKEIIKKTFFRVKFLTRRRFRLFRFIFVILLVSPLLVLHYIYKIPSKEGLNVDLSYQIISQNPNVPYKSVHSVNLRSKHLEGANLVASVLADADLRDAQLQYSSLNRAKLNGADLSGVNLSFTDLRKSDFRNTILKNANFLGAQLDSADLKGAILDSADFRYANLIGVKHLTLEQLLITKTLYKAKLDSIWLKEKERYPRLYELHTTHPDSLPK